MVNQTLKSIIHAVFSILVIYFLGGIIPKAINWLDHGIIKNYLIGIYWIAILSIILFPQYWVWFTEEEIDMLVSLKSMVAFFTSTIGIAGIALISGKITNALPLSSTSSLIFTIAFWLVAILLMYVPQVFVYEPLKEQFGQ